MLKLTRNHPQKRPKEKVARRETEVIIFLNNKFNFRISSPLSNATLK